MARQKPLYLGAPAWLKPKPYPHFDAEVKGKRLKARVSHLTNRARVATRRFYPFIKRIQATTRYVRHKGKPRKRTLKLRPIAYAAHTDAHVFARYGNLIEDGYREVLNRDGLAECVVAYRRILKGKTGRGKSNVDHAGSVFRFVIDHTKEGSPLLALAFDIKNFFGTMDHALLKEQWVHVLPPSARPLQYTVHDNDRNPLTRDGSGTVDRLPKDHYNVFRAVTRYTYVYERDLQRIFRPFYRHSRKDRRGQAICTSADFRTHLRGMGKIHENPLSCGIPQGSPMSAVLSNIYMLPLDRKLHALAARLGGLYRRYSDDLILVVPEETEATVREAVEEAILERKLKPQHKKSEVVRFVRNGDTIRSEPADGKTTELQYLGFTFDGAVVSVRPTSLNRYLRRIQETIPAIRRRAAWLSSKKNANTKGHTLDPRRLIYRLYTHHCERYPKKNGRRPFNFILYLERASETLQGYELDVSPIQRLLGRHMMYIHRSLNDTKRSRRRRPPRSRRSAVPGGYS